MRTLAVVEVQIPAERSTRLADAVVSPQIDLFVFDRAPEPLDEHVVAPCAFAIHADRDGVSEQQASELLAGELLAGELAALVGVENLGLAVPGERLFDRLETELDFHRDRHAPRQNPAA